VGVRIPGIDAHHGLRRNDRAYSVFTVRGGRIVALQDCRDKPGKEAEVISFLEGGLALVQQEPATITWFAIRLGPSEFGIFDAFPDDTGRQAHLGGQVAAALMAQAPELLAQPPVIEPVDVLAAKLPG
jgi:quinol monooxygenase YgiN